MILSSPGFIALLLLAGLVLGLLAKPSRSTAWFFLSSLLLILTGTIELEEFLSSYANTSIATIFLLIFITNGLKENFNLFDWLSRRFASVKTTKGFVLRLTAGVSLLSGLVNNTPLVALLTPFAQEWARKRGVAVSKILMPLSFATILGGMLTLIGTSTNLVLNGLVTSNGFPALDFLDFLIPGALVVAGGWLYFATIGYQLLPNRISALEDFQLHSREYLLEMKIPEGSPTEGKTVMDAGLRNLDGVFLVEVVREGKVIAPVGPDQMLQKEDLLYFAGDTDRIVDLLGKQNGLVPAKSEKFNLGQDLQVVETLIPANSSLAGKRVKDSGFRERFDAAIVAIHRNGQRVSGKIGQQELVYGDMLLLLAGKSFSRLVNGDKDLYWINKHRTLKERSAKSNWLFFATAALCIGAAVLGFIPLFLSLLLLLSAMIYQGFLGVTQIKKQLNLDLLVVLGSAMVLGKALLETGAAQWVAHHLLWPIIPYGEAYVLVALFLLTLLFTSFVTNVAAVSITFPLAVAAAAEMQIDPQPFFIALAFAASCAFLTPMGYQTNLMVQGPGGYSLRDFFRVGFPLTLLYTLLVLSYLIFQLP